jgi:VanZ family protein
VPSEDTGAGWIEPRYAAIAAGIVALIVYGSLYPFQFHSRPGPVGPLEHLLATCRHSMDRGDLISNILLYLPFGVFSARSFRLLSPIARATIAGLLGLALSTAIEIAQFYDLTRSSDLCDIYADAAGAFLGAYVAFFLRRSVFSGLARQSSALLLAAIWLGYELFPYVPILSRRTYTPLVEAFRFPHFPPVDLLGHVVFWLAAAALIGELFDAGRRPILFLLALCILSIRLLNGVLTPVDLAGAALALMAWAAISRLPSRISLVAALFLTYAILQALQPFHFLPVARHFGWTPFLSFIEGSRYDGSRTFLEKSFTYGALVWLWTRTGLSWRVATITGVALELALRLAQVWLPGRSAEITDAIMVLMLAVVMRLIDEPHS